MKILIRKRWGQIAQVVFWIALITMALIMNCSGQTTIPLARGVLTEGRVIIGEDPATENFPLTGTIKVNTRDITVTFKKRKLEKFKVLHYRVNSFNFNGDVTTLWIFKENDLYPDKAFMLDKGDTLKLYLFYDDMIFYYVGKNL